jgi:chaperonin GroES
MRALGDSIIVALEEEKKERVLDSGLVIPLIAGDTSDLVAVEVVAVGTGKECKDGTVEAIDILVGDKVLITKNTGQRIDKDHVMVRTDDVFAVE